MRKRGKLWLLLTLVAVFGIGWYGSSSPWVRDHVSWLASQPHVQSAFDDEGGSAEALIVLLAFVIVTPVAFLALALLVTFVIKVVGAFLYHVRLPEFISLPVVVFALGVGTYVVRDAWLPGSLYILGLVARAYLVFYASVPIVPH